MDNNRDELRRMARGILLSELKKHRQNEADTPENRSSTKDPLRNMKAIKSTMSRVINQISPYSIRLNFVKFLEVLHVIYSCIINRNYIS